MPGAAIKGKSKMEARAIKQAYTPAWTFRSLIVSHMHSKKIRRLAADELGISKFRKCFPDQPESFSKFGATQLLTVEEFLESLSYQGAPEFWTMWACLSQDPALESYTTTWLRTHVVALSQWRAKCKKASGQNPVIAGLLKSYCEANPGAK